MVMTSGSSALLWVAGSAPSAVGGRDYFQGGKSIPKPIVLRRHLGQGPFDLLALETMALAKMDWNNDALYDPLPVTISTRSGSRARSPTYRRCPVTAIRTGFSCSL
jgi:hypothetical protein